MTEETEREKVAGFAWYCMGSCHGDWAPETEAIYNEVMRNDETFEFYRKQWLDFERWKRAPTPGQGFAFSNIR
jgi:hypothetical protein